MIDIDEVIKLIDRLSFKHTVQIAFPVEGEPLATAYQHKEITFVHAELLKSKLEERRRKAHD